MGGGSSSLCTDLFGLASPPEQAQFSVEGKQYETVRLLGEGGFAFVYLVRDHTGRLYALKKARRVRS
jgi:serine/threonine kinase 16